MLVDVNIILYKIAMKNIKIQDKHGTCGIYNLANLLQNKEILKYENDSDFIPCGYQETNKILELENYHIRQRGLIVNFSPSGQIPIDFLKQTLESYTAAIKKQACSNSIGVFV